jgi:hypothetical protein
MADLVLACAAGVAVVLVAAIAYRSVRHAGERRAYAFALAVSSAAALVVLATTGLSPLGILGLTLTMTAVWSYKAAITEREEEGPEAMVVAVIGAAACGVLPVWWGVGVGVREMLVVAVASVGAVVAAAIALRVLDALDGGRRVRALVLATSLGLATAAAAWAGGDLPFVWEHSIRGIVAGAVVGSVAGSVFIGSARAISAWLFRWKATKWPREDVVDTLVDVVLTIEFGPEPWTSAERVDPGRVSDRAWRSVVDQLGYASALLRGNLARAMLTGNQAVDARLRDTAAAMSRTVEEWLFALRIDGPARLAETQAEIIKALPAAVRGEWQQFPRSEAETGVPARSRLRSAFSCLRSMTAAALPLVLVFAAAKTGALAAGVIGSLYGLAFTFFAIAVLSALDPKSADNVTKSERAFKGLLEIVPRA